MSVIIRPATTADIKTIREIIDKNKASRRMLEKETVTLDRKSTRLNSSH